jgi:hypothetical protein
MSSTVKTPREKMTAFANAQPLRTLRESLTALDAKPGRDAAERLTRGILIDVICTRSPAADAAFNAWANGDTGDRSAVEVIVAAVKGA